MNKIRVLADSTCDLSKELLDKYNIGILPLSIILDDKAYFDMMEITPDRIYEWSDQVGKTPKTASPTIDLAISTFKPILDGGNDILFFAISEEMSTTANVARIAAANLEAEDRVTVIDSQNLSTGIGLQLIKTCELIEKGMSKDEVVKEIIILQPRVRSSFVVDTLTYLHRGGRCSATAALFGNALKLKPKIIVEAGKMDAANKYRGKQNKVIEKYVEDLRPSLLKADSSRVFITHSGCSQEAIDWVHNYLNEMNYFNEILITRAGGVISSHCGYGTLGVLFIEQ